MVNDSSDTVLTVYFVCSWPVAARTSEREKKDWRVRKTRVGELTPADSDSAVSFVCVCVCVCVCVVCVCEREKERGSRTLQRAYQPFFFSFLIFDVERDTDAAVTQ